LPYAAYSHTLKVEVKMTQTWDPQAYAQNGAFVHGLAGGVLEWLDAQPGEYILDLGCGDGQLTQRIATTGATVLGVDASPDMIAAARERGIELNRQTPNRSRSVMRSSTPYSPTPLFTGFAIRMQCLRKFAACSSPAAAL
jgi:tRNA/tmRNA/rRNA uracil-C5-methylase (TrmA/RlmC/RlmD family)